MKKVLFIAIAIVAMGVLSNAQSSLCRDVACECSPDIKTGPGSCDKVQGHGACDGNSLCVNLDNDLANCGKLGRVCREDEDCTNGTCSKEAIILPGANSVDPPLALIHSKRQYLTVNSLNPSAVPDGPNLPPDPCACVPIRPGDPNSPMICPPMC